MNLLLEKNRNQKSTNKDLYRTLELNQTSRIIPIDNITKTVNTYKVFDDERNKCSKYRLNVTVNPVATNILINPITQVFNSLGDEIIGNNRVNAIQTINTGYIYSIGYDIFDNHFLRVNTFKTGNTLNDFTGTTLYNVSNINDAIDNNLVEDNGWFGFINKGTLNNNRMFINKQQCEKVDLFPTRDYFEFKPMVINGNLENNWDYCVTYPYKNKVDHRLVTDNNGINGLPIISGTTGYTTENGSYLQIATPYKHNLTQGDIIKFKSISGDTKTYLVYDIGDINRINKEHTFLLDIDKYYNLNNLTFINSIKEKRIVKVVDNIESSYYIRIFKKIPNFKFETNEINNENIISKTESNNIELSNDNYKLGFARNIFGDKLHQIQYTDDIDINLLVDNLGRPLTELYFTVIKRGETSHNSGHNSIFTKIQSGIDELPGATGYTNIHLINGNNTSEISIENDITLTGTSLSENGEYLLSEDDEVLSMEDGLLSLLEGYNSNVFIGDIVEYNKGLVKETILDSIQHRFNTIQREKTNNYFEYHTINSGSTFTLTGMTLEARNEGYYYKPHYKIPLKNYSSIITQGELTETMPCNLFISGLTFINTVVILNTSPSNQIKQLILKIEDISIFGDFDRLRISKLDINNNITGYTTTNIRVDDRFDKCILIPYNNIFFGEPNIINLNTYTFRKYYNELIPNYGEDLGNGKILWREILPEGIFNNEAQHKIENKFTNNRLYLNLSLNLYVRRQDPYGDYGIKSKTFPSDPYGNTSTESINNNKIEKINEIC